MYVYEREVSLSVHDCIFIKENVFYNINILNSIKFFIKNYHINGRNLKIYDLFTLYSMF